MTGWAPLLVVAAVVALDLWVYVDARRNVAEGTPVYFRLGGFTMQSPLAWLIACLLLWIFFFPVYLVSRSR